MLSQQVALFTLVFVLSLLLVVNGYVSPYESTLVFFYGPDYNSSTTYNLTDAANIVKHEEFRRNKTHCYLHGFGESINSESIGILKDAYSKRKTVNFLAVDWGKAAADNYLAAATENIEKLSGVLAKTFLILFETNLKRETFTLVGHSLGGQLAGFIGRKLIAKTNGTVKIYNMVVLDAAYPLFYSRLPGMTTVSKNDAEFLQSIHTDIGTYGYPRSNGHVDFWPNGGHQGQPGCPSGFIIPFSKDDLCSHQRSWRYWAESVIPGGKLFWAFPANSYQQFLTMNLEPLKDKAIPMGFDCQRSATGDYYLKTNSKPPYAIGLEGY